MQFDKFSNSFGDLLKNALQKKENANRSSNSRFRPKVDLGQRNRDVQVIIGLDFGTSFTKAYCNIQGDIFPIEFEVESSSSYYLPSEVYYDKKGKNLAISAKSNFIRINYFKYNMINDELKSQYDGHSGIAFDELCSAFFLANAIKKLKAAAVQRRPGTNLNFHINMGCPIANEESRFKGIYNRVLNVAYVISNMPNIEMMNLGKIADYYKAYSSKTSPSLRTVPELYAEALWFIEKSSSDAGIYARLDIGGGTVDFATIAINFEKGEKKTYIYSQGAKPLGVEILLKKFYPQDFHDHRDECLEELRKSTIQIPSHSKENPLVDIQHIHGNAFEILFFQGVMDVKDISPRLMQHQFKVNESIPYYTFGGGADLNWYHSIITQHNSFITTAGIPHLQKQRVDTDLPHNRLIVAYQLSQPTLPDIGKYPWEFKKPNKKIYNSEIPSYLLIDD